MGLQTVEHNLATVQNVITSKRIYVKMFLYLMLGLKGRRNVKWGGQKWPARIGCKPWEWTSSLILSFLKIILAILGPLTYYMNFRISFPDSSDIKESACNEGDQGSIPGLGRSPGEGENLLQHFCLENPHGQRSLAGYSPWGLKESDTTAWLTLSLLFFAKKSGET